MHPFKPLIWAMLETTPCHAPTRVPDPDPGAGPDFWIPPALEWLTVQLPPRHNDSVSQPDPGLDSEERGR